MTGATTPRDERKRAFQDAKRDNPRLTIALLSRITRRTPGEIEGYLYDPVRSPSWGDCYLVNYFLDRVNGAVPYTLKRLVARLQAHVWRLSGEVGTWNNERQKPTGATQQQHQRISLLYHGGEYSVSELAEKTGLKYHTIYGRVRHVAPGEDVTELIDRPSRRRSSRAEGQQNNPSAPGEATAQGNDHAN